MDDGIHGRSEVSEYLDNERRTYMWQVGRMNPQELKEHFENLKRFSVKDIREMSIEELNEIRGTK